MTMRATLRWAHADLRAHRGQTLFSVLTTAGIIASLLLAAAMVSYATNPWERIFTQTRGAHVWVHTTAGAPAGNLVALDGVDAASGPFTIARTITEFRGVRAPVELRSADVQPSEVARPLLVEGEWLSAGKPKGVVLARSLAEALWVEPGDTLTFRVGNRDGRGDDALGDDARRGDALGDDAGRGSGEPQTLKVLGIAETAELHYQPGEHPGTAWVLPSTFARAAPASSGMAVGLRLDQPRDIDFVVQRAVTLLGAGQVTQVTKWQEARADAEDGYRLLGLVFGVFGVGALLAAALVASGAISTRIRGQLRDISVLKAIGFTPGQVVRVFLAQHLVMALLAVAGGTGVILALGEHVPGRIGEAMAVWQQLPGHLALLVGIPVGAVFVIGLATGLAAWRAGRVPPVPASRAALPSVSPVTPLTRCFLGLPFSSSVSPTVLLGWRGAFPRRATAATAVARLTVPLTLITIALSVWTTIDRFQDDPGSIGLPAALTARSARSGELGPQETRRLLADHPQVAAVHPGAEVSALVPGQTGTITLRGLGTKEDPYPFTLAEGEYPDGPDEAVAGQGLLDLLQIEVGDWVRMTVEGRPQILHIVGRSLEPEDGGEVISTSLDTLRERDAELRPEFSLLLLESGADPRVVSAELAENVSGGLEIWEVPNPADGLAPAGWGIAGLVGVLSLIGLTELLTSIGAFVRDRGRDLLALRAIGLTPRQISGVIVASTGFIALAAAILGTTLGVLLSGWIIDLQGALSGLGAGIAALPSFWTLTALVLATVLGAVAAAVVPAARITRRRLADSLSATL